MPGRHPGSKHLHGTNVPSAFDYGKDIDMGEDAVTILVSEEYLILALSSIKDSGEERTSGVAKGATITIYMIQDIALAASADDIFGSISGDFLCGFVPEGDLSLCIDKVDTIKQVVDD